MKAALILILLSSLTHSTLAQTFKSQSLPNTADTLLLEQQLPDTSSKRNAFWFHMGAGTGSLDITRAEMIEGELGLSVRHHHLIISIGFSSKSNEAWHVSSFWGMAGYSFYLSWVDVSASGGIGGFSWKFEYDSIKRESSVSPGVIGRIQFLFHLPWLLGIGAHITAATSSEVDYISIGFIAALGIWNLK